MQRVALRDENLRLHQVDAGYHFGDGMLDLDARVDFDEIPLLRIDVVQEFDRARIAIVRFAREGDRGFAELVANGGREIRGGRDFDDFLVAALHRTIALVEVQQVTVMIGEDLHFQVPRPRQIFFEENARVAESRARFALRFFKQRRESRGIAHHAHAAPAATHGGFDDDRIADLGGNFLRFGNGLDGIFGARQYRDTGRRRQLARGSLVAKKFQQCRRRAYESNSGLFAGARERRVLGKKAVSRMNRVNASFFGERDDPRDVQIGLDGTFARPDLVRLVGLKTVQAETVLLRIDPDGAKPKLGGRAKDADGDLAAVGGEQFLDRSGFLHSGSDQSTT